MSWLLFIDESGHDHRNTPYEVRGGVALHAGKLWPFIQSWRRLELDTFGAELHQYRTEVKGSKLLDKDRYRWAAQEPSMEANARRKYCRSFLTKGLEKKSPTRSEFSAYGQASIEMARGVFELLRQHEARVFATAIHQKAHKPAGYQYEEFLRKDHVFLLERYFYFLEECNDYGLIVMDEAEKMQDRRFVRRLENYFRKTQTGRYRTSRIAPSPFFVASDMTIPVQAADLCIYCVNWGYRLPKSGMVATERLEIRREFEPWLQQLQFRGQGHRDGRVFDTYGITYIRDPFESRRK